MRRAAVLALCTLIAPGASAAAAPRDQVRIVGSSTAFPYAQAVAEEFSGESGFLSPVVESTGTGGGIRIFCGGVGPRTPDVTTASRRMLPSEHALCERNGVTDFTEARFGQDAVVIAQSRRAAPLDFSRAELFQALAASVEVDGAIVPNPYSRWSQIDPGLPDVPIRVFGPPFTSGTRDAFVSLVLEPGCRGFPSIAALPEPRRAEVCGQIRQDGAFVAAGESDNVIVRRLATDPVALGIFGYSQLFENADRLRAASLDGVSPTREAIASGKYGAVRPLYLYVKNAHRGVIPGLDAFLAAFVSEAAIGPEGYLADRGLIPLAPAEREALRAAVAAGAPSSGD